MKIRAPLKTPEEVKKELETLRRKYPGRDLELKVDPTKGYIELDTGGQFDDLSEANREVLREGLAIPLKQFANLLIAATTYDLVMFFRGSDAKIGEKTISDGLEEMSRRLVKLGSITGYLQL